MTVCKDKVVALTYEVKVEGQIVDFADEQKPLEYIHGSHMIIPKLEESLEGKQEGEEFTCTVLPEEGYGEYDLSKVFDIDKSTFIIDGQLREDLLVVGRYIPLLNSAGEVCQGMIMSVKEDKVTMDFNPPMAGKTLEFTGKVIALRDATEKELTEGLHGEFLPQEECGHCCHHHGHGGCHGEGGSCHHEEGGCCHGDGEGCCHHEEE